MSVKTIFKTLLGTAIAIVTSFMLIELFNVCIISYQIQSLSKISAHQACTLFTQETYKTATGAGATNMQDILGPDGTVYISGQFYNSTDSKQIWEELYKNSSEFKTFCEMSGHKDLFTNLGLLYKGIQSSGHLAVPTVDWSSTNAQIQANINATRANSYYKNMYTAANLGLPYISTKTVEKMFKWNLAQMYSNCNHDNIQTDENGNNYVYFKGYRCYVQDAKIYNIKYTVFDLSNDSTREAVAEDLYKYTGLTVKGITASGNGGIAWKVENDIAGNIIKDNALVMTAEIDYYVPIAYEGITPLKTLFSWVWNNDVEGFYGDTSDRNGTSEITDIDYTGTTNKYDESDTVQIMKSEDYKLAGNTVPSTGKLIFTLVK